MKIHPMERPKLSSERGSAEPFEWALALVLVIAAGYYFVPKAIEEVRNQDISCSPTPTPTPNSELRLSPSELPSSEISFVTPEEIAQFSGRN